ncbi:MAG: hypothetical protein SH809_14890 [Rhodothermales bacterium]|nr:hypothetical protein [Rhodothermales bacterium]
MRHITALVILFAVNPVVAKPCLTEAEWGDSRQEVHLKEDSPLRVWNAISSWYQEQEGDQMTITRYHFGESGLDACTQYTVDTSFDLDAIAESNERGAEAIRSMSRPDRRDRPSGIRFEYWGWDLGDTFAIAEVDKDDESGTIWYAVGELPRSGHRDLYRSWTGADDFSGDNESDIPADLQENPALSPIERVHATTDEFEGVTWYDDPMRETAGGEGVTLSRLKVTEDGTKQFVFGLRYKGSSRYGGTSWIFMDRAAFLIDGERYELSDLYDQTSRENDSYGVTETFATYLDGGTADAIVRALAHSVEAAVRLSGQSGSREYEI